jgi:MFS family permease
MADQLRESLRALADVFRNPGLRRLELAWVGSVTGEWAYVVALAVYAYEAGGATAVGLVALLRFLPSAAVAPFAAVLADRYSRQRVMITADAIRAVALAGAAAVALADGPAPVLYALAALVAVVSTAFQPAQAALIPMLARKRGQLRGPGARRAPSRRDVPRSCLRCHRGRVRVVGVERRAYPLDAAAP